MPFLLSREQTLKGAARARAEAAFAPDFRRLYAPARKYAVRFVGTLWADDVVQLAFIGAWESFYADGEVPSEPIDEIFYCILRRRIVDQLRQGERDDEAASDEGHVLDITARLENQADTQRVADGRLLAARIEYLLGSLAPQTRRVYQRAERNDWDAHVVARELGITYNTARWHLTEAFSHLRRALAKEGYTVPASLPVGRRGGRD